jgi:hypothetical protein
MNAVGMTTGAVLLVAGSVLVGEPLKLPQRAVTWVALGFAVVVGSVVMFVLYVVVLRYWAASRAAYGFVLTPFITVCSRPGLTTSRSMSDWCSGACWSWRACTSGRYVPRECPQRLRQPNHRPRTAAAGGRPQGRP